MDLEQKMYSINLQTFKPKQASHEPGNFSHGTEKASHKDLNKPLMTACLSGAAKLARRQCGKKKCGPRARCRKFEHRAVVGFAQLFFFFYTSTECSASTVENLDSPRHSDRQFYGT